MDQPFINQDPNAINQANHVVQGNIYSTDNLNQNQAQIPSNPQYMMPPNMNPPQGELPPEQPYYQQPQNPNNLHDKPINSQNNQIPSPSQTYYPPPQNAIPTQPQAQPYYPPVQTQGMAVPPQISPQPVYTQPGIPQTNYPPQVGVAVPVQVQPQPVYKTEYQNYSNVSQISHKGVFQPDPNTFYISTGCCFKFMPFIMTGFGILFIFISYLIDGIGMVFLFFFGLLFTIIGFVSCCTMYNNIYFIMGPNTLTVTKKAMCCKKTRIYNPGELQRVEFNYNYSYSHSDHGGGYMHNYSLKVVPTTGNIDQIFSVGSSNPVFTLEEIDYFLYYINTHIQTKMRV